MAGKLHVWPASGSPPIRPAGSKDQVHKGDRRNLSHCGYGVELAINEYVKENGRLQYVELPELTHVMKEEKRGFFRGFLDRLKMYTDLLKVSFENLKNR